MEDSVVKYGTTERAVYNSEDGQWYKDGDDPWMLRTYATGEIIRPIPSASADTYFDAFAQLFGRPAPVPAVVRSPRPAVHARAVVV